TMRSHRQLRYEIAPFNIPYALRRRLLKTKIPM
ncbi:hypothetical protein EVA_13889, partial [gut metagenome]